MCVARLWCQRQEELSQLYERRVVRKARVIVDDNRGGGRVREGLGDSAGGGGVYYPSGIETAEGNGAV